MPNVSINSTAGGGGVNITKLVSVACNSVGGVEPITAIPVANALSSWVKTDADTAAGNLTAGHGQTSGKYDVFWTGGRRYGVDGVVTVNALALDGGAGDNFPATADTTVVVSKQVQETVSFDGDALQVFVANMRLANSASGGRGSISFYDVANALLSQMDLPAADLNIAGGATNPFAGDLISYVKVGQASTSAAATLQIIFGEN